MKGILSRQCGGMFFFNLKMELNKLFLMKVKVVVYERIGKCFYFLKETLGEKRFLYWIFETLYLH